jgi:bis(5'-nucleosyl)-tetraphosphatase (symmetrical)
MSIYFVGDIQGCYQELRALLRQVNFDKHIDQLWIAGDMVARGPDSYQTMKFIMSLGQSVKAVLGNHDLHLMAVYAGIKKAKPSDYLNQLLTAPEISDIIEWLAHQPLLRKLPGEQTYMSHAGFSPQWSLKEIMGHAEFAQQRICSDERNAWLEIMYGEQPQDWRQVNTDEQRFRFIINAFTRVRYCYNNGALEFRCKCEPTDAPKDIKPWFDIASKQLDHCQWIFGHWATLKGECNHANAFALDTGCVWGEHLTLLRWQDKQLFTEKSKKNP